MGMASSRKWRVWGVALGLLSGLFFSVDVLAGMGISPPAGRLWSQISVSHWSSHERFAGPYRQGDLGYDGGQEIGARIPLSIDEGGGEFLAQNIALSVGLGVTDRLDFGVYLPMRQRSLLTLETVEVERRGLGDLWLNGGFRITPSGSAVSSRIVTELKVPLSETTFEVLTVPLSEGQLDMSLGQMTTWKSPLGVYLTGGMKFRYRAPVTRDVGAVVFELKPGNELELVTELAGEPVSNIWLSLGWSSTFAQTSEARVFNQLPEPRERRELHRVGFSAYVSVGRWISPAVDGLALSAAAWVPIAGVDQLSGPTLMMGLAWQTQIWDELE
ncbi:MAG: hypothetical protein ACNA8W_08445 [Bradymonadaceae bacterium]